MTWINNITTLGMDNHQEKIKALGITRSKSNYINQLWKLHCRDVSGVDFMATDFEDTIDEFVESEPSSQQVESPLNAILDTINSEPENSGSSDVAKHQSWLEQQLMVLKRLNSDVELRLRDTSSIKENEEDRVQ